MSKIVLCVDDSVTMQQVADITFRGTDFQYVGARSVDEALQKAKAQKPAVVLADSAMPGKTGYDLCLALKSDGATADVPVVILVGKDRVLSWNLGASRLYGRREDEVIGRPWSEIVGESGAVELLHILGTLTRRYQAEHRTSGGAVRNVMVTRTELTGTTGEREGAFALVLDVTESKALGCCASRC